MDYFERITTWVGSPASFTLHTIAFIGAFIIGFSGLATWTIVLLVLTTIVSLEAIYLSIFIQMTVNRHAAELAEVSEDVEDIQEDIEEMSEDMEDIQDDIEEINEEYLEEEQEEEERKRKQAVTLEQLTADVRRVLSDLEALKRQP